MRISDWSSDFCSSDLEAPPDTITKGLPGASAGSPLAVRMRPRTMEEIVGQEHLLESGSPLRRLIDGSGAASVLLFGPPGTGKTTMASLISTAADGRFEALSALSSRVQEEIGSTPGREWRWENG